MSANPAHAHHRAYALLALTALCWGGNTIFARLAVGEVSPMLLVTFRWLGCVLLMLVFARKYIRQDWPVLRQNLPYLGLMGALGFTTFNILIYTAAHHTTAVNIGIIQGAMPVFVLLGAFIAYKTPVTGPQMIGVAITMIGVITVGIGGSLERLMNMTFNPGDLMLLVACMLYSGYAVGLHRRPKVTSLGLFTGFACSAFLASLPLTAIEYALGNFQWPTPKGWLIAGLIVLLPSFLAQLTFMKGVALIGPGRAGVFINMVPVFASILAVAILNEPFEGYHALGLALVLGGIWLAERSKSS